MPSNYRLRLGSYDFPLTMRPAAMEAPRDLAEQERPRADGATQQNARKKSILLRVHGDFHAADPDSLQTLLDAMIAALSSQGTAQLWYGRDDRYINAQYDTLMVDWQDGIMYGVDANITITFKADPPYFYTTTAQNINLGAGGGAHTLVGQSIARPVWTIVLGSSGAGPLVLSNTTTGEVATLSGAFANGDTIVLDRGLFKVTKNGDATPGMYSGRMPTLVPGSNNVVLTYGTFTSVTFSWQYYPGYLLS